VLNLTEQRIILDMLLYEFRNMKFNYTHQNIIKSHKFFEIMKKLKDKNMIESFNNRRNTYYKLTDYGRIITVQLCGQFDTPKEYWFLFKHIGGVWYK
jgi:hypothetical protein